MRQILLLDMNLLENKAEITITQTEKSKVAASWINVQGVHYFIRYFDAVKIDIQVRSQVFLTDNVISKHKM